MATEMLSPDQIISHSGFSGAPSEVMINGTWIIAADNNTDITLDADWPLPSASLTIGANLQSINVIARKSASWAIVTGGIVHHTYTLTCTIETDQGRLDEQSMVLRVQER